MATHGDYNGWCRVFGIPLESKDCPECQEAEATQHRMEDELRFASGLPEPGWEESDEAFAEEVKHEMAVDRDAGRA
jgi:hypothetical protein